MTDGKFDKAVKFKVLQKHNGMYLNLRNTKTVDVISKNDPKHYLYEIFSGLIWFG